MHLTDDELVLHYYGEMTDEAEARACGHLEHCAACRDNLARLQRVLAAVDQAPVPEPDAWFESRAWARLEPELTRRTPRVGWLPWRAIAWGAAAVLVVIAAFVAGRVGSPPVSAPVQQASTEDPLRERVLLVVLGDHLDRSELALVEFVSGANDRQGAAAGHARLEELVAANRLYRRTAAATGDAAVADVLDELERVLIEIAGAQPGAPAIDLDAVRQRIDTRGLLFKVRVMREQLQERARGSRPAKEQDTNL